MMDIAEVFDRTSLAYWLRRASDTAIRQEVEWYRRENPRLCGYWSMVVQMEAELIARQKRRELVPFVPFAFLSGRRAR